MAAYRNKKTNVWDLFFRYLEDVERFGTRLVPISHTFTKFGAADE